MASDPKTTVLPAMDQYWRHYKGGLYMIVDIAHDTRSGEAVVVYNTVSYHSVGMWVRPIGEFLGYTESHERRFTLESEDVSI